MILELVGAPNMPENLQRAATGGRIVVIGVSAGAKSELNLLALMGKRARIHGSTLRARSLEEKAMTARRLEHEVLPLFDSGALRVPIAATYPLEEAAAAYERFAQGGKLGKIVLTSETTPHAAWSGVACDLTERCMHRSAWWRMRHRATQ